MKELLKDTIMSVGYTIFVDGVAKAAEGTVSARVLRNGLVVLTDPPIAHSDASAYRFIIPPSLVKDEGVLTVEWTFTVDGYEMTVAEDYRVSTPYSSWEYFKSSGVKEFSDYLECERVSRKIIDSYCGQSFGREETTYAVEGTGTHGLRLPRRLLVLDTVRWLDLYSIPNIITAPGQAFTSMAWEVSSNGWVLRNSNSRNRMNPAWESRDTFKRNTTYNISGLWGHDAVPTEVSEASKILTANFLCEDQKYRDKYLASIGTGDWDLKFAPEAFSGTGSATADDLLKEYRMMPGIGVI